MALFFALSIPSLKFPIWGGTYLASWKKRHGQIPPELQQYNQEHQRFLGESWEVSSLFEGPSLIGERPIQEILAAQELTYLIKFIDTSSHLSVQVHPRHTPALGVMGKDEFWFVTHVEHGAGVYLGLKEDRDPEEFLARVKRGEHVADDLNFIPAHVGDTFAVPAGEVHAIGADITLLEVQQISNITYRLWDWNRLDKNGQPRDLHLQQAMSVLQYGRPLKDLCLPNYVTFAQNELSFLVDHEDFQIRPIILQAGQQLTLQPWRKKALSVSILAGEVSFKFIDPATKQDTLQHGHPYQTYLASPDMTPVTAYAAQATVMVLVG